MYWSGRAKENAFEAMFRVRYGASPKYCDFRNSGCTLRSAWDDLRDYSTHRNPVQCLVDF